MVEQNTACAICGLTFIGRRYACQDHNWKTGMARGLLCPNCNHLLGKAKDSTDILRMAIAYLEHHDQYATYASLPDDQRAVSS